MSWILLCKLSELTEGTGKYVAVAGRSLGVYLNNGHIYALDDRCPHAGASISAGHVINGCAICPRHDWAFRLTDGYLEESQYVKVRTYPIRVMLHDGVEMVEANVTDIPSNETASH